MKREWHAPWRGSCVTSVTNDVVRPKPLDDNKSFPGDTSVRDQIYWTPAAKYTSLIYLGEEKLGKVGCTSTVTFILTCIYIQDPICRGVVGVEPPRFFFDPLTSSL